MGYLILPYMSTWKSIDNTKISTVSILFSEKKYFMVSFIIVTINHICMYTYVSEWFTRWLYYAVELCHRFVGVKHELLSKTTSANVKDYLSCIIGRDIN